MRRLCAELTRFEGVFLQIERAATPADVLPGWDGEVREGRDVVGRGDSVVCEAWCRRRFRRRRWRRRRPPSNEPHENSLGWLCGRVALHRHRDCPRGDIRLQDQGLRRGDVPASAAGGAIGALPTDHAPLLGGADIVTGNLSCRVPLSPSATVAIADAARRSELRQPQQREALLFGGGGERDAVGLAGHRREGQGASTALRSAASWDARFFSVPSVPP